MIKRHHFSCKLERFLGVYLIHLVGKQEEQWNSGSSHKTGRGEREIEKTRLIRT